MVEIFYKLQVAPLNHPLNALLHLVQEIALTKRIFNFWKQNLFLEIFAKKKIMNNFAKNCFLNKF